jgi:4-amino-4-deoxy-L-arabinose transferase-like glycosyltransferase
MAGIPVFRVSSKADFRGSVSRRLLVASGVAVLLLIFLLQLGLIANRESQTWDEGIHILAGYESWKHGDLGLNPEHPPLVKLVATLPILRMALKPPQLQEGPFKFESYSGGRDFLYSNDANKILWRTRMAASLFTLLLALLVFLAAQEMFGTGAGFIALFLIVFEPNLLAHGAVVATDAGISCFLFATIYAFYRYVKTPSWPRLLVVGVAAGFALGAKHTGVLLFPMLAVLALCEVLRPRDSFSTSRGRQALRLFLALVLITGISVAILWSFYGFRYDARPAGLVLHPLLKDFILGLKRPQDIWAISNLAHWHILPESYLYGLADVRMLGDWYSTYIFGKVYPHGVWFYFPVAFVIKSTLSFLVLLFAAVIVIVTGKMQRWREVSFLTIPPALHLAVAMGSGLNIGSRHILPLWIFLATLIGGASWCLIAKDRRWAYPVAALLLFHAVSSARVFPSYVSYSNELWGGPANTYKYLTDSSVDWAQQLKTTNQYLAQRGVKDCWFAFFGGGVIEPSYYGIPCKLLPTPATLWLGPLTDVPAAIDGPVLISAGTLSGFEFGAGRMNPYDQFQKLRPTAQIENGLFVFDGHFEVPLASALVRAQSSSELLGKGDVAGALAEAKSAAAIYPDSVKVQTALGEALLASQQPAEARTAFEKALQVAKTINPEFQVGAARELEQRLAANP